jgi:signal transduction histidine kinase
MQSFVLYGTRDGLPADGPMSFAEDRAGNLWIGFASGGVVRRRPGAQRFERFDRAEGAPAGSIEALLVDRVGRLWMGSSLEGVARVDHPDVERPVFVPLRARDGLSSDQVASLSEDREGRLYIATSRGLDRLEPETGRIRRYTSADGLVNGRNATTFRDRRGAIWLGTTTGLSRLLPAAEPPSRPPPVLITALRIGGVARPLAETGEVAVAGLELRPNERDVQIEFVGLSFAAGERLRYQYRLEGGNAEWSPPREERTLALANLAPGRYRFAVRAVTADGLMSRHPATIDFRLLPPFWRRGWFVLLIGAAAASLAFAFHRQRLARLLAVERVRTRIATDLHDDLGASLSRISILSEVASRQLAGREEPSGRLGEIADTARDLVDATADIVWSIDPRRDDLHSLLTRLRRFAGELLEARGIEWSLAEPAGDGTVRLTPELRQHLFLILKEAVTNAARHAEARHVAISIAISDGHLLVEVRDDGRGFAPPSTRGEGEAPAAGNGLANMTARARALGGDLRIESAPAQGTRVRAELPLRRRGRVWSWRGA